MISYFKSLLLGLEGEYFVGARENSDTRLIHLSFKQIETHIAHCPAYWWISNSCDYALYMNGCLTFISRRPFVNILAQEGWRPNERATILENQNHPSERRATLYNRITHILRICKNRVHVYNYSIKMETSWGGLWQFVIQTSCIVTFQDRKVVSLSCLIF